MILSVPDSLLDSPRPQFGLLAPSREEPPVKQRNIDRKARGRVIGLESAYSERDESEAADGADSREFEHPLGVRKLESRVQIESQPFQIRTVMQRLLYQPRHVRGHWSGHRLFDQLILPLRIESDRTGQVSIPAPHPLLGQNQHQLCLGRIALSKADIQTRLEPAFCQRADLVEHVLTRGNGLLRLFQNSLCAKR